MNTSEHGRMIRVNRAPVLTLWATIVAERLGFDRDAALTLGRAVAGSSAQMKGRALGIYEPSEEPPSKAAEECREGLKPDEPLGVRLLGRTVPVIRTPDGIRAMETPCCMDRRCGRIEPYPCSGSCGADILRASQLQHSVQHVGGDRHLSRLSPVGLEA